MRTTLLAFVLFAAAGMAQESRTFTLDQSWSKQEMLEFTTAVRAISDISTLFTDTDKHTLTLRGNSTQIGFVEWLLNTLPGKGGVSSEFKVSSTDGDFAARIMFLSATEGGEPLHKMAVKVRVATQIQRLFTLSGPRAIIVRGSGDQLKQADQLIREWDKV